MEPAVAVRVDPAGGGVLKVGEGLVRPLVEDGGADAFALDQAARRAPSPGPPLIIPTMLILVSVGLS